MWGMSDVTTKKRRRSRFVRPENPPVMHEGPRDLDIVRFVHEFRFLHAAHLIALTGGYKTAVEKRLKRLWYHGYLDRRYDQQAPGFVNGPAIYQLGARGAELLVQHGVIDSAKIKFCMQRNNVKQPFLQHALMVSTIRTAVTVATRNDPDLDFLFWRNDSELKDWVRIRTDDEIYKGVGKETWPIVPDGFFALKTPRETLYFMLEADRSTMDHRDMLRKMRAYFLWWKAGQHKTKLGIERFVVLTVALTKERMQNLFDLSRRADDLQKGSALFWFATIEKFDYESSQILLHAVLGTWKIGQQVFATLVEPQ